MLITSGLGDRLAAMLASASKDIVLAAPFVKAAVVRRLLAETRPGVTGTVITRWRPEEVAAGVSDLEVMDELAHREGWRLGLVSHLHAKYYRADTTVAIGSANLTGAALAWGASSNLEILYCVEPCGLDFGEFERELQAASVTATSEIRAAVLEAARHLPTYTAIAPSDGSCASEEQPAYLSTCSTTAWLPVSRNPPDIAYALVHGCAALSSSASRQVAEDLAWLDLPKGVGRDAAEKLVRARLVQHELVTIITNKCVEPQRFGAISTVVHRWMQERHISRDPNEAWQTLMRWMLYFFPERYEVRVRSISEMFSTKQVQS